MQSQRNNVIKKKEKKKENFNIIVIVITAMEFTAAITTLTKKLSNGGGYSVPKRSRYDGIISTSIKLHAPRFSYQFDDYRKIFCAATRGSISILELPKLNKRRNNDDVRRSKFDYSNVFNRFGNLGAVAVPFEKLVVEPKKKDSFRTQ